jgi:Tfp pilus tip-associated adhesin PilY1
VNVAVDTGSVHVFDAESGDAIYAQDPAPVAKTQTKEPEGAEA